MSTLRLSVVDDSICIMSNTNTILCKENPLVKLYTTIEKEKEKRRITEEKHSIALNKSKQQLLSEKNKHAFTMTFVYDILDVLQEEHY
jgi:hypothetical protein